MAERLEDVAVNDHVKPKESGLLAGESPVVAVQA
jgi:hypothetical protein